MGDIILCMKVKRKGDKVEIQRNKKRGLKLMIRDCSLNHNSCKYCYLNFPNSICSLISPCEEAGLLAEEYFIRVKP